MDFPKNPVSPIVVRQKGKDKPDACRHEQRQSQIRVVRDQQGCALDDCREYKSLNHSFELAWSGMGGERVEDRRSHKPRKEEGKDFDGFAGGPVQIRHSARRV